MNHLNKEDQIEFEQLSLLGNSMSLLDAPLLLDMGEVSQKSFRLYNQFLQLNKCMVILKLNTRMYLLDHAFQDHLNSLC